MLLLCGQSTVLYVSVVLIVGVKMEIFFSLLIAFVHVLFFAAAEIIFCCGLTVLFFITVWRENTILGFEKPSTPRVSHFAHIFF